MSAANEETPDAKISKMFEERQRKLREEWKREEKVYLDRQPDALKAGDGSSPQVPLFRGYQSKEEVYVLMLVPPGVASKDIFVKFRRDRITVRIPDDSNSLGTDLRSGRFAALSLSFSFSFQSPVLLFFQYNRPGSSIFGLH